ncbi:MAG: hypothetical protein LBB74_09440 [Chitinispirillales bacterium]|jgi:hypothetical protein|nr:hypothetical protein [Chitinispirillales bacterium]
MGEKRKFATNLTEDTPVVPKTAGVRDPMKFSNGDISLEEAIELNGGHIVTSNAGIIFEPSF